MNRTVTYPDGSTVTSVALNKIEMESLWQDVLAACIGLDITDPTTYSFVRAGWQTQGQPAFQVTDDIVFVRCETMDDQFSRLRDAAARVDIPGGGGYGDGGYGGGGYGGNGPIQLTTDVHTRAWKACITVYGPNSLDNARAILVGVSDIPYVDSLLSDSNVYINPSIEQPKRVPELFQGQWWERIDLELMFNEQITETFTVGTVGTVVVTTYDENGQLTTQTITV